MPNAPLQMSKLHRLEAYARASPANVHSLSDTRGNTLYYQELATAPAGSLYVIAVFDVKTPNLREPERHLWY